MTKGNNDETAPPVACALPPPELRQRASAIREGLARRVTATRELEDGIAFSLALTDDALADAEAFVAFEQRCCSFADFTLRRDDAGGALWIEVRGPAGTKAFFQELMPLVAPDEPGEHGRSRSDRWLSAGIFTASGAVLALVCCATPVLALALGVVGFAGATASVSLWVDSIAVPVLVASSTVVAFAWARRRLCRARASERT